MDGQLSLLAQPGCERIEVPLCPAVLLAGARACGGPPRREPLFAHRHIPVPPPALEGEREWLAALEFAEEARRSNQAARARLDLSRRAGAASSGPIGRCGPGEVWLTASGKGIEVGEPAGRRLVRWARLLAARAEQREVEPGIARARDLAEAYRLLDYYGRVYPEPKPGDEWSPLPLIRRLAAEARELGGDPSLLSPHTDYMREGCEP